MPDQDPLGSPQTRILVADDEPHIRRILTALLRIEGFEVRLARDGTEGIKTWAAGQFDLVILDLIMPRAASRSSPRSRAIPSAARHP